MILTDYYKFEKFEGAKTRYDCTMSTGEYDPFESLAYTPKGKYRGGVRLYLAPVDGTDFKGHSKRKATYTVTNANGHNVSSVFVPDLEQSLKAFGDTAGTDDMLIFLLSQDLKVMEIFVARGHNHCRTGVFNLVLDGTLDDEMEALRGGATAAASPARPDTPQDGEKSI